MTDPAVLGDILAAVERAEAKLLAWGIVDAGLTRQELEQIVFDASLESEFLAGVDRSIIIDELLDHRLLFRLRRGANTLFRSRMAESVRLVFRLRQFLRNEDWRAGRPLLSDYRFALKPRYRPRRDMTTDEVLARIRAEVDLGTSRENVISAYLASSHATGIQLAAFQVDAASRILSTLDAGGTWGTVVTAGTGSGKTHAFYMPAVTWAKEDVRGDSRAFTRVVALYPRQELLRDQLQTALSAVLRADSATSGSARSLSVGAWFGATPLDAAAVANTWPRRGNEYRCPYLNCPRDGCAGELIWSGSATSDQLTCRTCGNRLNGDVFAVTRRAMQETPPDFLFTTTESMNRQLSSTYARRLFGLVGERRPRLCLLDEIHTYEGTHGAHVANLLRRWRKAVGAPINFVGLSATLVNAESFFCDLTGLPESAVARVESAPEQLERVGDEYLLALRHDSTVGTSLLSATIQLSMLMPRLLDAPGYLASEGLFGTKAFVFTDRLDSVNRLYWDFLDSEGWYRPGRPNPRYRPRALATLRARRPEAPDAAAARDAAGQLWDASQQLGHDLVGDRQLIVGRTSSQDVGVDASAQVIVATSSLEVGFDDDAVGAVIQHKAPHNSARFLQRKGRAGRPSVMRPWTVVSLSDFGRDRVAFQSYERLIDPVLEAQRLPIKSPYVLKMQSVFVTLDWLARKLPGAGSAWNDLARPRGEGPSPSTRQLAAANLLKAVLGGGTERNDLESTLRTSLDLTIEQLRQVCWSAPRALFRHVLPTLIRRLDSGWAVAGVRGQDVTVGSPAPEFVPGRLFGELLVPELHIEIPAYRAGGLPTMDVLGLELGLAEFSPGNVTRRYAVRDQAEAHWVPVPDPDPHGAIVVDLTRIYTYRDEGTDVLPDGSVVRCLRPAATSLEQTPSQVSEFDRSSLCWTASFLPTGPPRELLTPSRSRWSLLLDEVTAFLHQDGAPLVVRRFAAEAEVAQVRAGVRSLRRALFVDDTGSPAALGFQQEVDALCVRVHPTDDDLAAMLDRADRAREYRWAYLQRVFEDQRGFPDEASSFDRHWLRLASVAALCAAHIPTDEDLGATFTRIGASGFLDGVRVVAEDMFPAFRRDPSDEASPLIAGRTLQSLRDLLARAEVQEALLERIPILWSAATPELIAFSRQRILATLGAILIGGASLLAPELDVGALAVDVTGASQNSQLWITETSPGSTGFVSRIVELWQQDPHRLLRVLDSLSTSNDLSLADEQLSALLDAEAREPALADGFERVRTAWDDGHTAVATATSELRATLERLGLRIQRVAHTTLTTRILSPGSNTQTDELYRRMIHIWNTAERAACVALDSRVAAYLASEDDLVTGLLPTLTSRSARFVFLSTLLWPRGPELARTAVEIPNRFSATPTPDVDGLVALLGDQPAERVDVTDEDWRVKADRALSVAGTVLLDSPANSPELLRDALVRLATVPTDVGFLHSFPRAEGVWTRGATTSARVFIAEVW